MCNLGVDHERRLSRCADGYAIIDQRLEIGLCFVAVPVEIAAPDSCSDQYRCAAAQVAALEMAERYLPSQLERKKALRLNLH